MIIGVPREIKPGEQRVALTPAGVRALAEAGHRVVVERGAGGGSSFRDEEYARESAALASVDEVWAQAEMILNQLADVFLATSLGESHGDLGAPWGVYPCAGDDEWCVITVRDDEQWLALRRAIGDPEWSAADEFGEWSGLGRCAAILEE